jgi:tetratricopeptide (TPR) repeat protein
LELGDHLEALRKDPTSAEAARRVREDARARGAVVQYAEAFAERGRRLAEQGHAPEAIASLIEAALVYEEELDDLAEAARLYQAVLDVDPAHRRALFALGLLLHDLSRYEDLVALYRRRLEGADDDGERTTLYLYVAEILSEKLDRGQEAFEEVMRAARLAPQNIRIISRLGRLGEEVGKVEEVAVAIGDLILNQDDRRVRAALTLHLAELYMGPLDDPQRALAHYKAALADDGGNPDVLSAVEDVFRERERFDQLAELLEEVAGDRRVGPLRVRLERELARIYELELGDKKRALAALTRAARLYPDDRDLLDEVMRLGLGMGALDVVAATFDDVAASTTNGLLRTYLQLKLGHIYGSVLDRPADAIRAYEAILAEDGAHKEARRRLGNLCERTGDFVRLAALAEEEARLVDGTEKVEPLRRLARVKARSLGDEAGAADVYRKILELAPGDAEAERGVTKVGQRVHADVHADVGQRVHADVGQRVAAPPAAARAELGPTRARAPVRVEAASPPPPRGDHVLGGPPPPPALDLAADLAGDALASQLSAMPSGAVETLLADMMSSDDLPPPLEGDTDEALDADDLLTDAALSVTTSQAVSADPLPDEPTVSSHVHLRALDEPSEDVNVDPTGEAVVWSSDDDGVGSGDVLPDHEPTVHARGVDGLALTEAAPALRLVPPGGADVPAGGETSAEVSGPAAAADARRAADTHERAAEAAERDAIAARLATLQAELTEAARLGDRARELALLEELVEVHLGAAELERAFFALGRLVRLAPAELAVSRLVELGRRAGTYGALIATADEVLPRLGVDAQARLGVVLAEVEAVDMAAQDRAEVRLAALHEALPDDAEVFAHWTRILEARGAHGALSAALEREARRTHDLDVSRGLWLRAARVRGEALGDRSGAATVLLAALDRSPDDEALREAARAALGEAGRWSEVVQLLEARLYRTTADARPALRLAIAQIAERELGDVATAEKMLRLALSEAPRDVAVLDALVALYESLERWEAVLEVLSSQLPLAPAGAARAALRRRLAGVTELRIGRPDLALAHLDAAVHEDPSDVEALTTIERLRREAGDDRGVVEALVRLARVHPDPSVRAHRAIEAARIARARLGDAAAAVAHYREALALLPDHVEALGELAQLLEELGEDLAAVDTLERLAGALEGPPRAHVYLRAGRLLEHRVRDEADAEQAYARALEAAPVDAEVLTELARWREHTGDFAGAANLIERQAELSDDDRRRATLWSRVAELARSRLGDLDRAVRASEQVLLADPDDLAVEAALGELYLEKDDADRAYTHLARAARGLRRADATRAIGLYLAAGGAAIALSLREQAIAAFDAVRELDPRRVEALWPLSRLLAAAGEWTRAHDVAASIVVHHDAALTPAEHAEVLALMARARRAQGDADGALRLAERSLATRVERHDALGLLGELYAEARRPAEAAEVVRRLAAITRDARERRGHLLRAARLWGEGAGELGRGIAVLGELHGPTPGDVEVAELLALYRERAGEPRGAVQALAACARAQEAPRRAELLVAAAQLAAGPARDRAEARRLLEEALSAAPRFAPAVAELRLLAELDRDFERLVSLYEEGGDLASRDRAVHLYRDLLGRPHEALRLLRLSWAEGAGDVGTTEALARALEACAAATPAEAVAHEREALARWSEVLAQHPGHLDALRHAARLGSPWRRRLYTEVLVLLGEATPEEQARVAPEGPWASVGPARTGKPLDVPPHPREVAGLDALFTQLGYATLLGLDEDLPEPRPKKRDKILPAALAAPLGAALTEAAALFGQSLPPLYVRDDAKEPLSPTFVDGKPALVVSMALAGRLPAPSLAFHAGRALSLMRARALPLWLLPLEALRDALEGLVRERVAPELLFGDAKNSKRRGKALERALPPAARMAVTSAVSEWLVKPSRATLLEEREAVLRTAERAGLVACGSLVVASSCLEALYGRDRRWRHPLLELAASPALATLVEG